MKHIFLTFLLMLLFLPSVIAIYDNNYRDCLAQKIYDDCEKNLIWTAETVLFPDGSTVIRNGELLTKEKVRNIVDFAEMQDNDFKKIGFPVESYPERFRCDDYYLRVNDNRYYWRGIEVTCPTNITKEYFRDFTLFGVNMISNGGLTIIGFTIVGIGGITLLGIGIVISFSFIIKKKKVNLANYYIFVKKKEKKSKSSE